MPPPEGDYVRPAAQPSRNLGGWLILALLFGLVIVQQLSGSIRHSTQHKIEDFQTRLKSIVTTEEPQVKAAGSLETFGAEDPQADLRDLEGQLAAQKNLDDLGREVYAAVLTEQKKPVPESLYGPLVHSQSPEARAFGRVYQPGTLNIEHARSLAVSLAADKEFVGKLAAVQALEKAGDHTARARLLPSASSNFVAVLGLTLFGLTLASMFVWIGYFAARAGGALRPLGLRSAGLTLPQADLFAVRAVQVFCCWLLIGWLSLSVFGDDTGAAPLFAQGLAMLVAVPILFKLSLGQGLPTLADLGVTRENLGRNVLWGLAGFLAEVPISVFLVLIVMALFRFLPTPQHPAEQELQQTTNLMTIAGVLFVGTIVAAFWEEIVFRGLLFPALGRVCKNIPAGAVVSSLIFASLHPQGAAVWPSLCVVGLMSCALSYQTRSLVPSMVMHFCHNAVLLALTVQSAG